MSVVCSKCTLYSTVYWLCSIASHSGGGGDNELRGVHLRAGDSGDAAGRAADRDLGDHRVDLPEGAPERVRAGGLRARHHRHHSDRRVRAERGRAADNGAARGAVPRRRCAHLFSRMTCQYSNLCQASRSTILRLRPWRDFSELLIQRGVT